ncbi:hypothetical protein [Oceanibaculum pacificum]|uniref:hypothetical protein n=1 Tax=Oceanibaculum pacificum TaxID=580166 RepID=UPI0012EDF6C7|nr:hypothetical protein [Oceanibaculum pacificum]
MTESDWMRLVYLVLLLALIGPAFYFRRRLNSDFWKDAVIWIALGAILVGGYLLFLN